MLNKMKHLIKLKVKIFFSIFPPSINKKSSTLIGIEDIFVNKKSPYRLWHEDCTVLWLYYKEFFKFCQVLFLFLKFFPFEVRQTGRFYRLKSRIVVARPWRAIHQQTKSLQLPEKLFFKVINQNYCLRYFFH